VLPEVNHFGGTRKWSKRLYGWVHEIKHDGFRLQIHVRDKRVRLYTMTGVDWTDRYP